VSHQHSKRQPNAGSVFFWVGAFETRPMSTINAGTVHWSDFLDRQMHRGLVHAIDRYY
jgi:hypothetical protein